MSEMNFNEHLENKEVNLKEFDELCTQIFRQRAEVERLEAELKSECEILEGLKTKALNVMKDTGKDKYHVQGYGLLYTQNNFTVSMPKDPEKKKQFLAFLEARGLKDSLTTVHSQTLNSFYKAELEAAVQEGNSNFTIPGLDEPKLMKQIRMRKA